MTDEGVDVSLEPGEHVACAGAAQNCKVLTDLERFHGEGCVEAGIAGADALLNAAAVGLVIEVWRNSPVEDMHARERGPSDAAMFAESTTLHGEAVKALTAADRWHGMWDFRDHLLDRTRPWAGTGGRTLQDLGRGSLGKYERHVRSRTNVLIALDRHTCVSEPLQVYLVRRALGYGREHKGMPAWPTIVERIGILLADPAHPAWLRPEWAARAQAEMPPGTPAMDQLAVTLLSNPASLPLEVLEWLSGHFLYCAAPPYSRSGWGSRDS